MKKVSAVVMAAMFALSIPNGLLWAESTDADNTGKNVRDRSGATVTPMDQSETERDRTLTQRIRQAITDDDTLSINGKNIKIVTMDGMVTLRGPVDSENERKRIVALAEQIAGPKQVESQLEINEQ